MTFEPLGALADFFGRVAGQTETGITVQPEGVDGPPLTARLRERPATGTRVTLGMRPEHLEIAAHDGGLPLAVDMEEDLGGVSYLHARTPAGQPVVLERRGARETGARENFEGRRIAVSIPPERALVFDEAGERVR